MQRPVHLFDIALHLIDSSEASFAAGCGSTRQERGVPYRFATRILSSPAIVEYALMAYLEAYLG